MRLRTVGLAAAFALADEVASLSSAKMQTFRNDAMSSTLTYVNNFGICETTPGVGQHSGYFDFGMYRLYQGPQAAWVDEKSHTI